MTIWVKHSAIVFASFTALSYFVDFFITVSLMSAAKVL